MRPGWGVFSVFLVFLLSANAVSQGTEPQDNYEVQVFLTEEEALKRVFPEAEEILTDRLLLSAEDRKTLEDRLGRKLFEEGFLVYIGRKGGEVLGYAVITQEVGKFHPFDFIVAVRPDGKIKNIVVLVYRESRGGEVARKRFTHQFIGKSLKNPLSIDKDIINITGATMSVVCMCEGVRKVLALVDNFYLSGRRDLSHALPYSRPATADLPKVRHSESAEGSPQRICRRQDMTRPVSYDGNSQELYKEARLIMGTYAEVSLYAPNKEAASEAIKAAFGEMERLDRLMSNYKPESELSKINREAGKGPVDCDGELLAIIERSLHYSNLTQGAFDITVEPLVNLWGFYDGKVSIPSQEDIKSVLPAVSYKNIIIQKQAGSESASGGKGSVSFNNPSTRLDLGAIGKGYAVDRAVEALKDNGIEAACVNLGGNIYALGSPPGRDCWKIGVQHPREKGRLLGHLELKDCAVATSGDYERFFNVNGKRYCHILDPRTGWPVEGMVSVTVVAPDATEADALSTSVFVLGEENGRELLESLKGTSAIVVCERDGEINLKVTRGMEKILKEESKRVQKDAKGLSLSLLE
ncbi:MAG TPA: FAD:protein FMN transferase [Candidatus Hypogeohydataceae bacterium YC41]